MLPSFFDEMNKLAADEKKSPALSIAKILGAGTLGFGAGTAAGLGTGALLDLIAKKTTGQKIPKGMLYAAGPLLGAAGGIAYSVHKAREQEAIQRALEDSTNHRPR